jgi:hypothetical protein
LQSQLNSKGRFILATHVLDQQTYPDEAMRADDKEQRQVERGFRFLKDPWFMLDSIFLKSPRRIEALMRVMTLCLLVYNLEQYRLRETLKAYHETLPNQLKKPVQNPTLRWVFQLYGRYQYCAYDRGAIARHCQRHYYQLLSPTAENRATLWRRSLPHLWLNSRKVRFCPANVGFKWSFNRSQL